jgi:hypothetical protein
LDRKQGPRDILSSARKAKYGLNRRLPRITARAVFAHRCLR